MPGSFFWMVLRPCHGWGDRKRYMYTCAERAGEKYSGTFTQKLSKYLIMTRKAHFVSFTEKNKMQTLFLNQLCKCCHILFLFSVLGLPLTCYRHVLPWTTSPAPPFSPWLRDQCSLKKTSNNTKNPLPILIIQCCSSALFISLVTSLPVLLHHMKARFVNKHLFILH